METQIPDRSRWSLELLQALDWRVFEELTAEVLRLAGFKAATTPAGPDGGVDILMHSKGSETPDVVVQCKRYKKPVTLKKVRDFLGSRSALQCSKRIFATTDTFGKRVHEEFGSDPGVALIDARMFLEGIEDLGKANADQLLKRFTSAEDVFVPTCPNCDLKMVRRITKGGENAGQGFWGCPNFGTRKGSAPKCRKTFDDAAFPDFNAPKPQDGERGFQATVPFHAVR